MSGLSFRERVLAETLFEAFIGPTEEHGLPSFASLDHVVFWRSVERAPAASFTLGLRAMTLALTALPIALPGYRKPFPSLSRTQRFELAERWERAESYPLRQMAAAMKTLGCFAYFDAPAVRACVERVDA